MKKIFITGMAGSGKTTISQTLNALGYRAFNMEHDDFGLFMMLRRDTGKPYVDYNNADMTKVNNASWVCNKDKMMKAGMTVLDANSSAEEVVKDIIKLTIQK